MSLTALIRRMQGGDAVAKRQLFEQAYQDLRTIAGKLMRSERPAHTLGATGLLHEAFLSLQGMKADVQDRTHFYAMAAITMRRALVDHGRKRNAAKRTVDAPQIPVSVQPLDPRVVDLMKAVDELRVKDPHAAIVVEMKHFLGLTLEEIAAETGRPYRKIREEWDFARSWLGQRLSR